MSTGRRSLARKLSVISLVAGALAAAGCGGSSNPWETVFQTHGQVQLAGKAIPGATLVLYPTDPAVPASIRPTATTDAEGRFRLGTFSREDGAPAGNYRVAVVWHPLVNDRGGPVRGPNKLPVKYSQPDTTPLTTRIEATENQLPVLELK